MHIKSTVFTWHKSYRRLTKTCQHSLNFLRAQDFVLTQEWTSPQMKALVISPNHTHQLKLTGLLTKQVLFTFKCYRLAADLLLLKDSQRVGLCCFLCAKSIFSEYFFWVFFQDWTVPGRDRSCIVLERNGTGIGTVTSWFVILKRGRGFLILKELRNIIKHQNRDHTLASSSSKISHHSAWVYLGNISAKSNFSFSLCSKFSSLKSFKGWRWSPFRGFSKMGASKAPMAMNFPSEVWSISLKDSHQRSDRFHRRMHQSQVDVLSLLCWNCSHPTCTQLTLCTFHPIYILCVSLARSGTFRKSHHHTHCFKNPSNWGSQEIWWWNGHLLFAAKFWHLIKPES